MTISVDNLFIYQGHYYT